MIYCIQFFTDIRRYRETMPCELHERTYPTAAQADEVARGEMHRIRESYGPESGFAIFDGEGQLRDVGPG
jgi:hypothetical protein